MYSKNYKKFDCGLRDVKWFKITAEKLKSVLEPSDINLININYKFIII